MTELTRATLEQMDWQFELNALAYAHSKPSVQGLVKASPEDFRVTEMMAFSPSGDGEHYWLDISKIRCNTDRVAKALAAYAGVAYRDVGYSGMKDFQAVTRQWFSVWKPKGDEPDWARFSMDGVVIHRFTKHNRKIKRGTHRANKFEIRIVNLDDSPDSNELEHRLQLVQESGVPNYFGEQRFGRNAQNIPKAIEMFNGKRVKDRSLRSLLLSSARSWLFNALVSARVSAGNWDSLFVGEPANLNNSNSNFTSVGSADELQRLALKDIHPTAAMWGQNSNSGLQSCPELEQFEAEILAPYPNLKKGLEDARLDYQRRAIRCVPGSLEWSRINSELMLCFELPRGQFATSVLRELILPT